MCVPGLDPISVAAIAASAGGALYNNSVNNAYVDEVNNQNQISLQREQEAQYAESMRQSQMENDQAALITQALFQVAPETVEASATQAAEDTSSPHATATDEYNLLSLSGQGSNANVNEVIGKTVGDAARETRGILSAAATLSGQAGAMAQSNDALGRMGSELQTLGGFRRGSMNAAQREAAIPSAQVTRSSSPIGDLLMLGGMAGAGARGNAVGLGATSGQPLSAIPWMNG